MSSGYCRQCSTCGYFEDNYSEIFGESFNCKSPVIPENVKDVDADYTEECRHWLEHIR